MGSLVPQEAEAFMVLKDTLVLRDAEVHLGFLVRRVPMVLQVKLDPKDLLVSQVTKGLLEILVQLV